MYKKTHFLTRQDLDQLNHILGVLGSPSQEDLNCIINDKVGAIIEKQTKRLSVSVPVCYGGDGRMIIVSSRLSLYLYFTLLPAVSYVVVSSVVFLGKCGLMLYIQNNRIVCVV